MSVVNAAAEMEKRRAARFPVALPAQVSGLPASTRNVSMVGTQLSFPSMNVALIADDLERKSLAVVLELPDTGALRVRGTVAYVCDYGDEHLIGVHFEEFPDGDFADLERYITALGVVRSGVAPAPRPLAGG